MDEGPSYLGVGLPSKSAPARPPPRRVSRAICALWFNGSLRLVSGDPVRLLQPAYCTTQARDDGAFREAQSVAPTNQVHVLDAGHFALDTAADGIAGSIRGSIDSSR